MICARYHVRLPSAGRFLPGMSAHQDVVVGRRGRSCALIADAFAQAPVFWFWRRRNSLCVAITRAAAQAHTPVTNTPCALCCSSRSTWLSRVRFAASPVCHALPGGGPSNTPPAKYMGGAIRGDLLAFQLVPAEMPPPAAPGAVEQGAFRNAIGPIGAALFRQAEWGHAVRGMECESYVRPDLWSSGREVLMKDPMLLVTDLDAFMYELGRESARDGWVFEREERASLAFWEAQGDRDMVNYVRGRLSTLDDECEEEA